MGDVTTCYILSVLFLLILLLFSYMPFRTGVDYWFRSSYHMSRTKIRKSKKGKRNYWWYEALHREKNLGAVYYVNKIFTVAWLLLFLPTVALGFIKEVSLALCPLRLLLYLLGASMTVFGIVQGNLEEHGRPFVLLAQRSNRGFDTVFLDIAQVLLVLGMGYFDMKLTASLWGVML